MSSKSIVMLGAIIGSSIGGYIPIFFGVGFLSTLSLLASAAGGLIGIWIAYKKVM